MTVSSNTQKTGATAGTGAAQVISFTFPVQSASEVAAVRQNTSTGAITAMVKDTDYSVSLTDTGNNNYTGSITTLSAVPTTDNIVVYRDTTDSQAYNPINNDDMDAETLESAIDKLFMLYADLKEEVGRCLKVPMPETSTVEIDDSVTRASKYLKFDSNGDVEVSAT